MCFQSVMAFFLALLLIPSCASTKLQASSQTSLSGQITNDVFTPSFDTESERVQFEEASVLIKSPKEFQVFLSLPTFESKEAWLETLRRRKTEDLKAYKGQAEVELGMTFDQVVFRMGPPKTRTSFGSKSLQNEEWTFETEKIANDEFVKSTEIFVFRSGRLVEVKSMDL